MCICVIINSNVKVEVDTDANSDTHVTCKQSLRSLIFIFPDRENTANLPYKICVHLEIYFQSTICFEFLNFSFRNKSGVHASGGS